MLYFICEHGLGAVRRRRYTRLALWRGCLSAFPLQRLFDSLVVMGNHGANRADLDEQNG